MLLRALGRKRVLNASLGYVWQTPLLGRGGAVAGQLVRLHSSPATLPGGDSDGEYQHLLARIDSVGWRDTSFDKMLPSYLAGKLPKLGIELPTPVQASSIETLMKADSDVLMQAVTGAFGRAEGKPPGSAFHSSAGLVPTDHSPLLRPRLILRAPLRASRLREDARLPAAADGADR